MDGTDSTHRLVTRAPRGPPARAHLVTMSGCPETDTRSRLLIRANMVRLSQVFASCLVGLRQSLASTTTTLV